jgi:DNA-binding NarL/FixJ family response regulator
MERGGWRWHLLVVEQTIRVVVVDDSLSFREALVGFLAGLPALVVVGEASDGREAIDLVGQTTPDVVIMDVVMPGMDGIAATRALKRLQPSPRVIVCTLVEDQVLQEMALAAGADAFVLKRHVVEQIERLLHAPNRPSRRSTGWRS